MSEDFDPFKLVSGLPLAGADCTVTNVEFGYDAQYNAEACVAIITFQPDEGDAQNQLYSVGKNFEPAARGKELVHKSGKNTNVNDSSNYGRFVKAYTEMDGAAKAMKDFRDAGATAVFNADWLEGCRFSMGTIKINVGRGAEMKEKDLIVPVAYLGREGQSAAASAKGGSKLAPKAGSKVAVKPAAKVEAEDEAETWGIEDEELLAALIDIAANAEDFDAFTEAATDLDGVIGNKPVQKAVMSSKAGSLWDTHKA